MGHIIPAGTGFDGHRKLDLKPLVDPVEMEDESHLLLGPESEEPNPLVG